MNFNQFIQEIVVPGAVVTGYILRKLYKMWKKKREEKERQKAAADLAKALETSS